MEQTIPVILIQINRLNQVFTFQTTRHGQAVVSARIFTPENWNEYAGKMSAGDRFEVKFELNSDQKISSPQGKITRILRKMN